MLKNKIIIHKKSKKRFEGNTRKLANNYSLFDATGNSENKIEGPK